MNRNDTSNLKRKALKCAIIALRNAKDRESGNKVRKDFECFKNDPEFREAVRKKRIEFENKKELWKKN